MKNLIISLINSNVIFIKIYASLKPLIKQFKSYFSLLINLLRGKNFFGFFVCMIFFYIFIFYKKKNVKRKYSPSHYSLT